MKFLLVAVNAKYIHSNPAVYSLKKYAEQKVHAEQPQGVENIHIEIAEYTINQQMDDILADIYRRKPDVTAFSCYIWNIAMVGNLLVELRKLLPQMPIWLGGPEAYYEPAQMLAKYPFLAGIMVGEGEQTFTELAQYYGQALTEKASSSGLREIAGLYLPDGYTEMRQPLPLDDIPFLYDSLEPFQNRILYYETSRGCPFRCSYCLSSIDKGVRLRSLERSKEELQFFLDAKVPQVKFIDRTFNCNHEHAMGIWRYIHEHDNGVTNFHFEIAADILREDELELLGQMRPGLVQLEIGVQTTNEQTLSAIERRMDVEKLRRIVKRLHDGHNIHLHLDLIAGLPYEDYTSFHTSFDEVYAMEPEQLQLGFLKVLKGSAMYERAEQYGIAYLEQPPYEVLFSKWLTYEDVRRLKRIEEMVEIYYNSGQFTHVLPVLVEHFGSPFLLFEKLAEFYEEQGYFTAAPARSYRYHVLLEFAEKWDGENMELYRELCTFDVYLRENAKSRPEFAKDIKPYYDTIRDFYSQPKQIMTYLSQFEGLPEKQIMRMTHMEMFSYPVWELCGEPQKVREPYFVLFDYESRNPLDHSARYQVISLTERESEIQTGRTRKG